MLTHPTDNPARNQTAGPLTAALVFALLITAHLPAILGVYVWDDDLYIKMNRTLARPDGLFRIWFRPISSSPSPYPLVFTTYWFEYRLWGEAAWGYRLVNVALHAANALLLARVLRRLAVPGAVTAAIVFALHPINAESVAHIAERKDVLSGFFYLLALLAWLNHEKRETRRDYLLSVALFALAMLSKTVVCTLPVTLLLIAWWKGRPLGRTALRAAPHFAIAFALGVVTILWERFRTGASGEGFGLSLAERTLIAGRVFWFYPLKLLWPSALMTLYPKWPLDTASAFHWMFPLAAAAVIAGSALLVPRRGRAALVPVAFFVITLGPASGYLDYSTMFYSWVMDHYQYLAGIGVIVPLCAMASLAAERLLRKDSAVHLARTARILLPCALGLFLTALSLRQTLPYGSLEDFWRTNARLNPGSATAAYDLALELKLRGTPPEVIAEAEAEFLRTLELSPDYIDAWIHLGDLYESRGDLARAEEAWRRATTATPPTQKMARGAGPAWAHIASLQIDRGETEEAEASLRRALDVHPGLNSARNLLASLLIRRGAGVEAETLLRDALERDPGFVAARINLASVLLSRGEIRAAASELDHALRIDPDRVDARVAFATVLAAGGRFADALTEVDRALERAPDDPAALNLRERIRRDLEAATTAE